MKKIIKKISKDLQLSTAEAELVLSTLLERPRFEIYTRDDLDPDDAILLRIKLHLLKKGVPIEYIAKKVQFLDRALEIHPGVFIPRLETEYFVELVKNRINFEPQRVLDMGTGCGALSIGLAGFFPTAAFFAVEKSREAVANARINIVRAGLSPRIHLVRSDFLGPVRSTFDLIVSNPPYVPTARIECLPDSVKDFEPRAAIDGGADGTFFIRRLLEQGPSYLAANGALAIEIDEEEVDVLDDRMKDGNLAFSFHKDLFGRIRYMLAGNFNHSGATRQGRPTTVMQVRSRL